MEQKYVYIIKLYFINELPFDQQISHPHTINSAYPHFVYTQFNQFIFTQQINELKVIEKSNTFDQKSAKNEHKR